jgi:hypothetical protein
MMTVSVRLIVGEVVDMAENFTCRSRLQTGTTGGILWLYIYDAKLTIVALLIAAIIHRKLIDRQVLRHSGVSPRHQ